MSTSRDPDRLIRSFLQEGEDQLFDQVYDRVRAGIEDKPQRAVIGPWRMPIMNKIVGYSLAAAALLAVVLIGAQLLGSPGGGIGGPGDATTTPQPPSATPAVVTLASGSFTAPLGEFGEAFDIEAVRTGDNVSGTMEISDPAGAEGAYSVDVQCSRTTDDGFRLIGGEVTESTYTEFIEDGAYVVIILAPGTPVRMLWAADVLTTEEDPAPAESCSAFIERLLDDEPEFVNAVGVDGRPVAGDLELGE